MGSLRQIFALLERPYWLAAHCSCVLESARESSLFSAVSWFALKDGMAHGKSEYIARSFDSNA